MQSGLSYDEPAGVGQSLWGEEALETVGSVQRDRETTPVKPEKPKSDSPSRLSTSWHDFMVLIFCVSVMLTVLNAPIIDDEPWLLLTLSVISLGIAYYIHIRLFHPRDAIVDPPVKTSVDSVDAIMWRADGASGDRYFINSQAEELLGFPIEHLKHFSFFSSHVHPDDLEGLIRSQRRSLSGKGTDCSYRFRDYWGRTRYLHERVSITYDNTDGVVSRHGIILDETRQWEAEEASRRYRQLIENVSSAVMIVQCIPTRNSPEVIHHNAAMAELYQFHINHVVDLTNDGICVQYMSDKLHVTPSEAGISGNNAGVQHNVSFHQQLLAASEDGSEQSVAQYCIGKTILHVRCIPMANRHVGVMVEDVTKKVAEEHQLRFLAHHDPLTRLANRPTLYRHINTLLEEFPAQTMSVAVFDLDEFKGINDNFGHEIGDRVLCEFADRLTASLQGVALVARIGGDEFAAVSLAGVQPEQWRTGIATAYESSRESMDLHGLNLFTQASIGCAEYPADASTTEELFRLADQAMYRAKFAGGGIRYHKDMRAHRGGRIGLIRELHSISQRDGLQIEYHLRRSVDGTTVTGAKALAYWHHPEHGKLSPQGLLDAGVSAGFDLEADRSLTRSVVGDLISTSRRESLIQSNCVDIALSAESIRDPELCLWISEVIEDAGIDPGRLCFTVREQDVLDLGTDAITAMWQLQSLDVKIGVADCTGEHLSVSDFAILPICHLYLGADIHGAIARGNHTAINLLFLLAEEIGATIHATACDNPIVTSYLRSQGATSFLESTAVSDLHG